VHCRIEQLAMDALRQREAELVAHWTPTVRMMSLDLLGTNALPAAPRTLEDLSRPIILVIEGLGALGLSEREPHEP
jgi:hypothetical protein